MSVHGLAIVYKLWIALVFLLEEVSVGWLMHFQFFQFRTSNFSAHWDKLIFCDPRKGLLRGTLPYSFVMSNQKDKENEKRIYIYDPGFRGERPETRIIYNPCFSGEGPFSRIPPPYATHTHLSLLLIHKHPCTPT